MGAAMGGLDHEASTTLHLSPPAHVERRGWHAPRAASARRPGDEDGCGDPTMRPAPAAFGRGNEWDVDNASRLVKDLSCRTARAAFDKQAYDTTFASINLLRKARTTMGTPSARACAMLAIF